MLKINKPEVAFAIKLDKPLGEGSKKSKKLKKIFKLLAVHYPTINIEGINVAERAPNYKTTAKGRIHGIPFSVCSVTPRKLLCVGVSKKSDVSLEVESSVKFLGYSIVKILDLDKNFKEIEKLLVKYMLKVYPEQTAYNIAHSWKEPAKKIVRYSTHVEVDGEILSYPEFNALRKDIIVDTRKKKTDKLGYASLIALLTA